VPDNGNNSRATASRVIEEQENSIYDIWEHPDDDPEFSEDTEFYTPPEESQLDLTPDDIEGYTGNGEHPNLLDEDDELFHLHSIDSHIVKGKSRKPYLLCIWKNGDSSWEVFHHIRKDFPSETANYVVQNNLRVPFKPDWAKKYMEMEKFAPNELHQRRTVSSTPIEMFGVKIPKNVTQAYEFDKENGNTLWTDAISKEINSLLNMSTFEFYSPGYHFSKSEGWQFAPLRMIFAVKHDLRCKARMVAGGHVTDASMYDRYAATVHTENIRLLFYLLVHNNLDVLAGDVGTAYLNAITEEKIFSTAGPEFGDKQGQKIVLKRALYGLKTSAHAWFHHFAGTLREMGFRQSKLDGAVWFKLCNTGDGYDTIAHHVDDFLIAARNPTQYMNYIKTKYVVTGDEIPEFYLGINCDVTSEEDGWMHSAYKYIEKCITSVEKILDKKIGKSNTPNKTSWHPEEDQTPLLDDKFKNKFQQLVGMGVWLSTICRVDITFPVLTLSRFNHAPREGHLVDITRVFEYISKFPKRCLVIDNQSLDLMVSTQQLDKIHNDRVNMLKYYPDTVLEDDPTYPEPIGKPVEVTICVDADHASDTTSHQSMTGIVIFLGCTPYKWISKRQTCITTSTFGAEFAAMRIAVEEAIAVVNLLKSIGIPIKGKVRILGNNKSVIDNSTIPGSALKKKHTSIAYHRVRECIAVGLCDVYHIKGVDNPADILTKAISGDAFKSHVSKLMSGPCLSTDL
jgi:hypothetical protein